MSDPGPASMPTLAEVDAMDQPAFAAAFGTLFEHAAWIAESAWHARPFGDADALHAAMMAVVRAAPLERQRAFLNGHPELAGREAEAGSMTSDSTTEQRGGGLDALSADEFAELRGLNRTYRERHGFPFIVAVLDNSRAQIFEQLRMRLPRDSSTEHAEALTQIARITRRRLRSRLADGA